MYTVERLKSQSYKKYARSNLPIKYIDNDISEFRIIGDNAKQKKRNEEMFNKFMNYYDNVGEYLKQGRGLYLCGPVGVAKTWLLTHLAKKIIDIFEQENSKLIEEEQEGNLKEPTMNNFYYIQGTTVGQLIFPSGLNEKELNIRRGIKTIAGLWIDDISKIAETKSGHEISFLDDVIRWRDLNMLPTFYTSQIPFDAIDEDLPGLDKLISKPIHDMIRGNCDILTFVGDSQR